MNPIPFLDKIPEAEYTKSKSEKGTFFRTEHACSCNCYGKPGLWWWAYRHIETKEIHLKRWFRPSPTIICDFEYAVKEKDEENDNIGDIVGEPFEAKTYHKAFRLAMLLLNEDYKGIEFL